MSAMTPVFDNQLVFQETLVAISEKFTGDFTVTPTNSTQCRYVLADDTGGRTLTGILKDSLKYKK